VPRSINPNMLTLCGLLLPLLSLVTVLRQSAGFDQTLPHWVWAVGLSASIWHQMFDALDGLQAKRAGKATPLGRLLDHSVDQIVYLCTMLSLCSMLKVKNDVIRVISLAPAIMSPHFSVEFRTYFTGYRCKQVGIVGSTDLVLITQTLYLLVLFSPDSNQVM
jgi:phosphatidylglycerophosphate synthase